MFMVLMFIPLVKVFLWRYIDYGLILLLLNFTFFFTPIKFVFLVIFGVTITFLFGAFTLMNHFNIIKLDCRYSTLMDSKVNCEEITGVSDLPMMAVVEPVMAVGMTFFLASIISYVREKIQRKNFLLISISECQKRIMHLRQEENSQMLASMLPAQMIERLKSKEATVVVDSYSEVSVLFAIIDNFVTITSEIPPAELVKLLNIVYVGERAKPAERARRSNTRRGNHTAYSITP